MSERITRLNAALEGRYRIESELGEGGMASVYLAHDVRHERQVAVKVLKPELAAVVGADRFLAEIKTTAHLQHPNILPLFDSGEADGLLFYVMPYVRGETLRQKLDRERQLPVDEAVKIAADVAGALDYAHREGVIHRDIKPANILLHDGRPVISDFGIALAVGAGAGGRLTETGLSLGTPHYMSPEQAAGDEAVGAASDIYALGCLLYEALAGSPPFVGSTAQSILAKVVTADADPVTRHRRSVPANVEAAIRRCLEKVPADRFRSAGALAEALVDERFRYGTQAVSATTRARVGWVAALALIIGAGIGAGALSFLERPIQPEPVTFIEAPPAGTRFLQAPLPSPDGRSLAMLVTDASTETKIWVRSLGSEDARPIDGSGGASVMFWSPDGQELLYQAAGELRRVSLSSGGGQLVAPLKITAGTWTPDGKLVVATRDGIAVLPAAGGAPRPILQGSGFRDLDLVGAGPHVLFGKFGGETGIHTLDLSTGEQKVLFLGGTAKRVRYVSPDLFVYAMDRVLLAQRFRVSDMSLVGDPFSIARDVGDQFFAGSASGALSFVRGTSGEQRLVWFDRRGDTLGDAVPKGLYSGVHLSPQGTRMMFVRADPVTGNMDLWVQDLVRGTPPNRFTTDDDVDHLAAFSPDGKEIAWEAHAGGKLNIMRRPTDASAPAKLVTTWGRAGGADDWSPDGRFLLYWADDGTTGVNIWAVPMQDDAKPFPFIESAFDEEGGKFSPDGHWLAYASNASGQPEIYLQRLDGMQLVGGPLRVSDGGGTQARWRADGKELFFLSQGVLMATDIGPEEDHPAGTPRKLFDIGPGTEQGWNTYAVTPDGQRFLVIVGEGTATTGSAVVILNWSAGLEGR